ncbi:MAG: hypothetical protein BWY57_00784 [Betaproteobacteria bacterium ADurb.Bin341]|nr:MAG: hypothetical protein BWY57_00784 [Betaproteobacteria bacterium ADurb.Bin341]
MQQMTRKESRQLIINADDLGICPERDAGIFKLFEQNAISSATLLVNGENAGTAARQAIDLGLPLGLHLNLTEGPAPMRSSLNDGQGRLRGKKGLWAALARKALSADDLTAAIRAQFDRFIALTGELPSHVDGHHHIHVAPQIAALLAPIMAKEYGIYCIRIPCERTLLRDKAPSADEDFEAAFQRQVAHSAESARAIFAAEGLYSTDAFLGQTFMGRHLQADAVATALAGAQTCGQRGVWVELMVHPGIPATDPARGAFCRSPDRAHEMAVLQSPQWQRAIAGWQLASFRDLPRPEENKRPTVLIYSKLTPATGNAETARRYAAAWSTEANIRFRPLPPEGAPLAVEQKRLRELANREHLDLAFGIHIYRAGLPLTLAFASDDRHRLSFGLLASGTDANADIEIPQHRQAMLESLRHARFLICLTEDLRHRLQDLALPEDTTVQPHGIDLRTGSNYSLRSALQLGRENRLILFPASLRRIKGILPAIEALAEPLANRWTTHVLIILGPALEPSYAEELHRCIKAQCARYPNLAGRLRLHPGLPHADYLATLSEADLVLNASDHEGLSHTLAEAMAAGVPVLARANAGNCALVRHGETGRLFSSFPELPGAYAACFDAQEDTARMARQAQTEITRRFPAKAEKNALRAVLRRALKKIARPSG